MRALLFAVLLVTHFAGTPSNDGWRTAWVYEDERCGCDLNGTASIFVAPESVHYDARAALCEVYCREWALPVPR